MKQQLRIKILGIYDLLVAIGAIITGVLMIRSGNSIFKNYPKEWLTLLPFKSWVLPGVLTIILFGLGNIIAAIFCLKKGSSKPWYVSFFMGIILIICILAQIIILGELYLATFELLVVGVIHLYIVGYVKMDINKKVNK